jgi:hypothetical protein
MVMCSDTVGCSASIDFGHWCGENDKGVPAEHFVIEQWNKRKSIDQDESSKLCGPIEERQSRDEVEPQD